MKCILSHTAACIWYLSNAAPDELRGRSSRASLAGAGVPHAAEIKRLQWFLGLEDVPLDLLVSDPGLRRTTDSVHVHVCRQEPPEGSLVPIPSGLDTIDLYIVRPELAFLLIARSSNMQLAIYTGMALCSDYRLDPVVPGGVVTRGESDHAPTSVEKIRAYLVRAKGCYGYRTALQALGHVTEHARSPKESGIAMFYGLPAHYGGMHLGEVALNPCIRVYRGESGGFGEESFEVRYPDVLISARGRDGIRRSVSFDYDADSTHKGDLKQIMDRRRANSIATVQDLTHYTIATFELGDIEYLIRLGDQARRVLKRRKVPILHEKPGSVEAHRRLEAFKRAQQELWDSFLRGSPGY